MSDQKKDGGPAFACASENGHQAGMSLRDWLAGQSGAALLLNMGVDCTGVISDSDIKHVANISYRFADAMLAAKADRETG